VSVAKPRSNKRDIDRAKKERAALKRERRQQPDGDSLYSTAADPAGVEAVPPASERDVLDALDVLHERFDAGEVGFDEFEALKLDLLNRLAER
jgi:hypothetical protein